jgi:hypothetical protein
MDERHRSNINPEFTPEELSGISDEYLEDNIESMKESSRFFGEMAGRALADGVADNFQIYGERANLSNQRREELEQERDRREQNER